MKTIPGGIEQGPVTPGRISVSRRAFLGVLPALAAAATSTLAAGETTRGRRGLCSFSCHQQWKAVATKQPGVKFSDAIGFLRYAGELGGEGVQTGLRSREADVARQMRTLVERNGRYYEGELALPKSDADLEAFTAGVRLTREAGARVARAVFTGGRRYEIFKTRAEFDRFHATAGRSLELAEPILRRHGLKLAIENHKDLTTEELVAVMRRIASEWIGVLVDTGNNLALLEEPHAVVDALAPFALSVHLKDMAVQPDEDGFLLSEVRLGTGMLDLPRIVATLRRANPGIVFNLEMATRDPLRIPCLTDGYWATFPERKATHLAAALALVKAHPPKAPPPAVRGKTLERIVAEEEANNRHGLLWMRQNISA